MNKFEWNLMIYKHTLLIYYNYQEYYDHEAWYQVIFIELKWFLIAYKGRYHMISA